MRRVRGIAVALALAVGATGCAALFAGYGRGPDGLPDEDREVRLLLVAGRLAPDAADGPLPDDELLSTLYRATLDLQAGRPGRSAEALDRALALTEDRYTRSVSRTTLSLLASDRVVPWEPLPTERLLIHYYAARAWLAQDLPDEAAVEARRLSALLDRLEEEDDAGPRLRTFLQQFAGVVFEAAGEANDAEVAYRKAARAAGGGSSLAGAAAATADSTGDYPAAPFGPRESRPPPGWGEVVLLVERGFVAHKVEEAIHVTLPGHDVDGLSREGDERGALALEIAGVVARIAGGPSLYRDRVPETRWVDLTDRPRPTALREADECRERDDRPAADGKPTTRPGGPPPGIPLPGSVQAPSPAGAATKPPDDKPRKKPEAEKDDEEREDDADCDERDRNPYLLRIAWPAFREGPPTYGRLALEVDDAPRDAAWRTVDLTSPLVDDFGEGREWLLARTLARAAAKAALTRGLERKVGEKDEVAGRIVGILANAGTALLERADTRSWHLLPHSLTLTRIALPAGTHRLSVGVEGAGSAAEPLPTVEVRPGELVVVGTRIWK